MFFRGFGNTGFEKKPNHKSWSSWQMSCLGIPVVYVQPTGLNAVSWLCNRNIKMFKAHLEEKNKAHVS